MLKKIIIFFLVNSFLLFAETEYPIQKHSDVISEVNLKKIIGEEKGTYISYWPLRSFIYPNYTRLSDEELLEHFKNYNEAFKKTSLAKVKHGGYNRVLKYYYQQYDFRQKELDKYDEYLNKSNIVLLAELKIDHGKYRDLGCEGISEDLLNKLGNSDLYEFQITKVLKDVYSFYKINDSIKCYNPPLMIMRGGEVGDKVPSLKIGYNVILRMVEKGTADVLLFNGNKIVPEMKDYYLNPYLTTSFDLVNNKNEITINKLDLDTLKYKAQRLNSKKEEFYKIKFSLYHDKNNKEIPVQPTTLAK